MFFGIILLKMLGVIVGNLVMFVMFGDLYKYEMIFVIVGFFMIVMFDYLCVCGVILIGIIGVMILLFFFVGN